MFWPNCNLRKLITCCQSCESSRRRGACHDCGVPSPQIQKSNGTAPVLEKQLTHSMTCYCICRWVSVVGAAMSVGYSLLAGIVAIAAHGADDFRPDYSPRGEGWPLWRGALNALGAVTFAYGGHRCENDQALDQARCQWYCCCSVPLGGSSSSKYLNIAFQTQRSEHGRVYNLYIMYTLTLMWKLQMQSTIPQCVHLVGPELHMHVFTSRWADLCSVLLEIQATLKTPPSARESMMKGIYLANAASACCYFFVAVTGYSAYGNIVDDDVLASRPRASKGWIALANLMVVPCSILQRSSEFTNALDM